MSATFKLDPASLDSLLINLPPLNWENGLRGISIAVRILLPSAGNDPPHRPNILTVRCAITAPRLLFHPQTLLQCLPAPALLLPRPQTLGHLPHPMALHKPKGPHQLAHPRDARHVRARGAHCARRALVHVIDGLAQDLRAAHARVHEGA